MGWKHSRSSNCYLSWIEKLLYGNGILKGTKPVSATEKGVSRVEPNRSMSQTTAGSTVLLQFGLEIIP